ncbi:hypothetical protein [Methylobacterium sp. 285MFTsu5.1]|uniref:hypothetical protein n=1 Tax=Methylobacterium sp. 285MFTsu5.1 TaxID=1172187 RepID=UPI00035F89EB|nr:hypothetical protein [Methylobacterium sp. 285MFTsu5.1]
MAGFKFSDFAAMFPIRDVRRLPDNAATVARNMNPVTGAIEAIRAPRLIQAVNAGTKRVFRIPTGSLNDLSPASSYWWQFTDGDTDVLRTPIVNDQYERYYWCSPSTGLRFASKADIINGNWAGQALGVPRPASAPIVSPITGTGGIDPGSGKPTGMQTVRSYVTTFVNVYGEEGQPSDPFEATGYNDQDWQVAGIGQPVNNGTQPNVVSIRIYRTVTGSGGNSEFYRVVTLQVGTTLYTDRLSDALVSGNPTLGSNDSTPPPAMDGIAMMAGGIMVGFKGNTLYFSEAYKPHAWPVDYALTVQHPIVGLGVFGNSCVVLTTGFPAVVSGTQPAYMTLNSSDMALPCLSRHSIVSTPDGVFFASTDGLVVVGSSGINPIADSFIGREIWQTNYQPQTIEATLQYGHYCAMRTMSGQPLGFMAPVTTTYQITNPLPQSQTGVTDMDGYPDYHVGMDNFSGKSWLISGTSLYEWLPADTAHMQITWRSKELQVKRPLNLPCAMLFFDADGTTAPQLQFRVWADRRLIYDQPVGGRNAQMLRLPTGFKATIWQVEVQGYAKVHEIQLAASVADLKGI